MSDEGKKRRAARYKQYVANKNTTANKNAGEKKSTLRFPLMSAEELNSFGGDNTNVKGYDYANRPIYADEVANHPERRKVFRDIVDKRVVADASEPFAKLDKDGNIVGIPNDNSAHKDVGKVFNNDKTNREKYTRTPLQEGYNREKALEEKKNKLREEYSTTLKPEIDTEVDDEIIKAINEKRLIQDEYNRQKGERERLSAENNKNPRWYEGWDGSLNTDMIDKANELSWKQIEGYDLDNADQRALAILKLSLPYSRARQSYINQAKTISDRANQQGRGSMWQGVVDNLADFTGLDEAFSAIEMGKSARHYIREYERFNKIYNSDQAREKAIQSLNKEDRANLEVFTVVQQVLAGNEKELSNWYKAGQITGDMLPFMLQLGASSTIVKGASRLLRRGAKKIAEKQMAKGISTALLNTAISPATQRAKNEEYANIRLFENRDITAKDRAKVYGQQAIENLTETVGVPFAKLGVQWTQRLFKGIGAKMLEKPMINRTFGKITKFAERPQQWIKIANKLGNNPVSKFLKDNLFFGGFGEEAFEEVEGALGNTVLGYLFDDDEMKKEFSNFWQADNLSVLALGLAPMTMFPLSFGISNAVVSHRDAKAYQQAREQLLGVLRQAGLENKKIIDGLEGKIIEGKPHEVIETLSALRRAAQGSQNEKDIDEAIYNYIAGARRLNEQRNELNAQLQQMNNAQRKEYVDNIIENIHRQQKNNILYQGIKNGYYQELQDPNTGKREKYICEVYNKNGTSIGFITDKEQDDNGNVLFTIVDGLGQVQRMTLDDIYRQAEGGEDANNPIVFTKVRDVLDYLYEQAGEDEELRADIQTRNLLQDAIKRGADGSNVINVARLNDGRIMFLTDINEQSVTVTGLVQTQDGVYQPQQISLSEVAETKEQNVEDLIDNTANIFNANIEADGILPQNTMPYYSSDKQDNKKEETKTTPEETEKDKTTEEKESAFTVGDKVAVSVDKGNIDSYGEYDDYDGKEYEVKEVRGNQVVLDIDGKLKPININKQGVTLTKVENNTEETGKAEEEKVEEPKIETTNVEDNKVEGQEEKTEAKEQGTTETEKAKEETETQKQEEKTKSLTERIKSGEILSQNAEETLVDLYSNMSKEDAQEVVNGIIKQTQDRQKQLAKKTINYEDIDKFQQHKKQVRETEKKLAYWNEVKSLFTAPLSQEEEVQSMKSIKEKESALGQAYSMREYILRNLALGAKFLWNDSENGTKGLGSHLGLRDSNEERRNYYAFLNGKDRKAVYPEVYAERLLTDVRENINPNVSFDEVFNEMIDCLSSYSTPTAMMDEAVRMHYEAEDNLTQNDFEKQQQAMIDRAEKREEDRIQDELNKQEALSEEDYERMRQGFDEQERSNKESKEDAERNDEEIKPIGTNKWGNVYQGKKGKAKEYAHFLEREKSGYVKDAFSNKELGNIDLNWGNEKGGLKHIIDKHIKQRNDFASLDEAIDTIEDVLANGEMTEQGTNRSFDYNGYRISVAQSNEGKWVITAFEKTRSKENKERKSDTTIGDQSTDRKENGTLVSPDLLSNGKDTTVSENEQEKGEKNDKEEQLRNELISLLKKAGIEVITDKKQADDVRKKAEEKARDIKTTAGEVYGFTVGGKVYVDERIADASTPIHEYTHLWAEALRKVNPKEWQNIVGLMKKQTYLWDKVKKDYPELKTDDEIADEVLAHYSGERGKKLLNEEYNKIRDNNKLNIFDKAKMLQAINNVREVLRKFWKGVADFLGIHFTSAEEVADKVLSDLLEGVNPNEVKSEEKEIIEKAKADGTYMKAPNGKKSNLDEKQWVQVRTKAFKKWFGDWEKSARIEKLRKSESITATGNEYKGKYELNNKSADNYIKENLRGEYTNKDTKETIKITRIGAEKVTRHDIESEIHLKSVALIPEMLEKAIFITEETNEKAKRGFDSYKYYVVGLKIDGVDYTAKMVVGVKNGQTYYDHALTEISKEKLLNERDRISTSVYQKEQSFDINNVKDKRLLSILEENSSKILDENGEPKVVYHQTDKDFTVFDPRHEGAGTTDYEMPFGIFMKPTDKNIGVRGNKQIPLYANIKKPLQFKSRKLLSDWLVDNVKGYKKAKEEYDKIDKKYQERFDELEAEETKRYTELWNSWQKGDISEEEYQRNIYKDVAIDLLLNEWRESIKYRGSKIKELIDNYMRDSEYDGVILENDKGSFGRKTETLLAFKDTQVKSATDNVGTFDGENADIRFHKSTERVVEKATNEALEEVKDPILKRAYKGILKESTKDKWASFADDYHALRVMEDKVIEEMRKRDPKFRLHHSVYEQQIAAKAATQGQIFLFSQQTFKPLLDKVDKIANKYNLSQKEVEQFMIFQFYRERTDDVIYNRWRETQDRIDAGRTPNKEYKEEYDAVKKYMGSLTDRERAEAERKANEIFDKIAEEKTFGSLEEMDEEFDQLKTEMYARAAADKYRQQELWDTNNKDGIRGFAGEESMCRTALYQTIAENYFPKEKGNMTTTRLTPDEIIEKFRDMVGKDNVDELNKLSRAVTQFTLDKALETGNITREEYEKYQRQEYYVPLRGWDKDDGEVSVFGNDTSFQSVNPNAKGRTTTADNPLKYMFVIASNQIHDFNEKQAKRSLINFINEYKDIIIGDNATSYWSWNDKDNNKVYDVKRPKKNEYLKGTLEFHVMNESYERVYPKALKDYTFTFKDGDKTYNMYLPSKYLVKILNKDKQPDGKIIQWLSKGTRFLASMRTSKNPSFVAANFSRDALVVLLLDENRSKEFPHFRKLFLENLTKMQTVWRSELKEGKAYRGSKMDNEVQKLYNQWVYYGGMSGYSFFLDDIEKEYKKRYKDLQRSTKRKVVLNVIPFSSQFLDIFNKLSEFTENQVRFAAFRAYLEASEIAGNPLTVQEAVYKSKEATLNFSRSGWGTRTLGKIFPFFNAAMQGIIKLARVLRYNPTRFWGAVSIAVGVGALDAFLSLILGGDDDKKNKYLQINDYVKERNLIIMRAMIPIPQELYIPFTIGVNLMEAYLGKKTVTEAASRIINALGELLPSEVGTSLGALVEYDRVNDRLKMTDHPFNTIISALAPGIVQPIADFNRNRDFMDRPILPKEPKEEGYNKKIAQAGRYDEYKTYKVFQDAAFYYNNLVSIITKHEPISWDREYYETLVGEGNKMAEKNGDIGKLRTVSPQAMQFFFGQYLPAISNIATKVGDIQAGRKALSGENIPIVDRLVVKHDKHASLYKKSSLVYDILDEQPNKKTLKKMKKAADDEHKERYDKAIQDRKTKVVERYNKNKDKLTRLRMEVKLLRIQGAVKNEKKIDELLDKQEEIYDKILRDWNKKE